jgi:hypothetical protein
MAHFTYNDIVDSSLKQGDVIRRTDEILGTIREVHPYFASENYFYFIVLTQTCDLVRRNGEKCKSRYITIAAVRPLEECLQREAMTLLSSPIEKTTSKIIDSRKRPRLKDFLERLLNNNHPDYFYLHQSLENGLTNPYVGFLRVSIALKAEWHYEKVLAGKILELKDDFKAKLGWLVGNLYSRVGTEDWVPKTETNEDFIRRIEEILDTNFYWVPNLKEVEKKFTATTPLEQLQHLNAEEIAAKLKEVSLPTKKQKLLSRLSEILDNAQVQESNKLLRKIENDTTISDLLKG